MNIALTDIPAQHLLDLPRPAGAPGRTALPVAGDDTPAKCGVLDLIEELGFDAVAAGVPDESWRQPPGTPAYARPGTVAELKDRLATAGPQRPAEFRSNETHT